MDEGGWGDDYSTAYPLCWWSATHRVRSAAVVVSALVLLGITVVVTARRPHTVHAVALCLGSAALGYGLAWVFSRLV